MWVVGVVVGGVSVCVVYICVSESMSMYLCMFVCCVYLCWHVCVYLCVCVV